MGNQNEQQEIFNFCKGINGSDMANSIPLIQAQSQSLAYINVLDRSCADLIRKAEKALCCEICLLALGSLGRLEYVPDASDCDPVIVVSPKSPELPSKDRIRSAILVPIAEACPWLMFDDKELVLKGAWDSISSVNLKYPVYTRNFLLNDTEAQTRLRRSQIILESVPLGGEEKYQLLLNDLTPRYLTSKPLIGPTKQINVIDFSVVIQNAKELYASFENPAVLFKSPFKYWKTRFLRDFYAYSTNLLVLLGWYLQKEGNELSNSYLGASTVTKLTRATQFATVLDESLKGNTSLAYMHLQRMKQILEKNELKVDPLLRFGQSHATEAAQILHGLIVTILTRFAYCREKVYDLHVRTCLNTIEPQNFDSMWQQKIDDPAASAVVHELSELRTSYHKYMSASAEAIVETVMAGRLWGSSSVPFWVGETLKPFIARV